MFIVDLTAMGYCLRAHGPYSLHGHALIKQIVIVLSLSQLRSGWLRSIARCQRRAREKMIHVFIISVIHLCVCFVFCVCARQAHT